MQTTRQLLCKNLVGNTKKRTYLQNTLVESPYVIKGPTGLHQIEKAAVRLLGADNSQQLYKVCVAQACHLTKGEYGSVFLEKNGQMIRVYSTVPVSFRMKPRPHGNTYKSFLDGKIRYLSENTINSSHPEASNPIKDIVVVPLTHNKKRLGAITIMSGIIKEYAPEVKQSLKLFGSLATLAINNMTLLETVKASLQTRELFLSTASHELKTPIASISAYAQLTEKNLQENKPIKPKWLKAILFNSHRLEVLIADLFNISKMSLGGFEYIFGKACLKDILTKVVSDYQVITERKISFINKVKTTTSVEADETKLTLVFNNILGNAMKYSPPETPITITFSEKENEFIIKVADNGYGINKTDLPHIFDRFYQGKNKRKGMGLGLYLSNEIVSAHHGKISITSQEKKGTTVSITLPKG